MDTIDENLAVIQPLNPNWNYNKVAALDMLRLDVLHPIISGNKWYKLRLNIQYAQQHGCKTIVTFGGGFSNHLIATAHAAKSAALLSVGIIRGKYDQLTPTLIGCQDEGMELIFVTKQDYNLKDDSAWISQLTASFDSPYHIPEGGANELGRAGAGMISNLINDAYTHIAVSVGTGTTFVGLRNSLPSNQTILGFVPMKQGIYLKDSIAEHIQQDKNTSWQLFDDWHFGGFGKWNDELTTFMNHFHLTNHIPLDIVYTAKMMFGIRELIENDYLAPTDKVLCIHTGGLQGNGV